MLAIQLRHTVADGMLQTGWRDNVPNVLATHRVIHARTRALSGWPGPPV